MRIQYRIVEIDENGSAKPIKYGGFRSYLNTETDRFDTIEEVIQFCQRNDIHRCEVITCLSKIY